MEPPSSSGFALPRPQPTNGNAIVCNACSATVAPDGRPLQACAACHSVAYCSAEHQQFDWKRHKPLCRTLSGRLGIELSSAASTSSSQSSGHSTGSDASNSAVSATANTAATHGYSHLILPPSLLHNPTALAAAILAQQQQPSSSITSSSSLGSVNMPHPPPLAMPAPAAPASLNLAQLGLASATATTPTIDPAVLAAAARQAGLSLSSAFVNQNINLLNAAMRAASGQQDAVDPSMFPALGGLSALGLQSAMLQHSMGGQMQLPHPSAFPPASSFPDPPTGLPAPTPRRDLFSLSSTGNSSSQPRFDLGIADSTPLMKTSTSLFASPSAKRQSLPGAVTSSQQSQRVKAVPIRFGNRNGSGSLSTTGSSSPSTSSAEKKSMPPLLQSLKISPSDRPSVFGPQAGSRKRGTPSPPENNTNKGAGQQAGITVDPDEDIQVVQQTINRKYKDHTKNVIYNVSLRDHQKDLMSRGYMVNSHQAMVLRLRYMAEHVIRALNEFGWAVVDNFLGTEHVKFASKEMEKLYEKGLFTAGQLMEAKQHRDEHSIKEIRSDYIYWYDGVDTRAQEAVTLRLLISMIDSLILHFENRIDGHRIGGRSRAMLAIYPGNSTHYVRHVDNPNKDGRLITCIYYCNADWDLDKHGGALRLYPESCSTAMDVDPQADRLVFFWSDRRNPHEVMPVHRHRFAITIWYMDKDERQVALKKKEEEDEMKRNALEGKKGEDDGVKKIKAEMEEEEEDRIVSATALVTREQPVIIPRPSESLRPSHYSAPEMASSSSGDKYKQGMHHVDSGVDNPHALSLSRSAQNLLQQAYKRPANDSDEEVEEEPMSHDVHNDPEYQI